MILRLSCLILLISLATGTGWYIFRDTPQKKIQRWRELSAVLFEKHGDLEKAAELNKRILKLVPGSAYDLAFNASLKERKGTTQALNEALAIYDGLIARGDSLMGICLYKSRVLRALGRNRQARAVARSVVDTFPFAANMDLGDTALASRQPREAAMYYAQASRHASHPLEVVKARESQANAYWLAISKAKGRAPQEQATELSETVGACRTLLRQAYDTLIEIDEDPDTKDGIRLRLAALAEKRARLVDSDETPYWSTAQVLRERVERDEKRNSEVSAGTYARLGNLYLQALHQEVDRLDDRSSREVKLRMLRDSAETYFLRSLGDRSPSEARTLVHSTTAPGDEDDSVDSQLDPLFQARRDYVLNLLGIAKVYLATSDFGRILQVDHPGRLALATRIADAHESSDSWVVGSFSVIRAFAHLKSGDQTRAAELLDSYVAILPDETRARATVDLARQCFRTDPESPLTLKYLRLFETSGAGPLDLASQRLHLLEDMSTNGGVLANKASKHLEKTIAAAEQNARTVEERIYVAELLIGVKGLGSAVKSILQSPADIRTHPALQRATATLLTERGLELAREGEVEAAIKSYRAALTEYLSLFLQGPTQSDDVTRRAAFILRALDRQFPELSLEPLLPRKFRDLARADREQFGAALKHFLLGQFDKAVQAGEAIENNDAFQPFWSYATGICHLQIATRLRQDSSGEEATKAAIALAVEAFQRHPEYSPNKVELISLELGEVDAELDVPEELLTRIQTLKEENHTFEANWMLARALELRFRVLYRDREVKNSAVTKILHRRQSALREVIRQRPRFTPAYIALADSFIVSERLDQELSRNGSPLERKLHRADYERAILLLESTPEPNARVLALVATYSTATGQPRDARVYLETLCMVQPTPGLFIGLLTNYLGSGTSHDVEVVLGEREAADLTPAANEWRKRIKMIVSSVPEFAGLRLRSVLREIRRVEQTSDAVFHEALLSVLREKLVELPNHERLGHTILGQMYAARSLRSQPDDYRQSTYREKAIAEYEEVIRDYDQHNLVVPLKILNNLAWILVDGPEVSPAQLSRGLKIAERARAAVENLRQVPDVIDTYAWALYRSRRLIEAESEFRKLVEVVESPTYRYHLACVLADLKRFGDAHTETRRALDSTMRFPEEDAARALKHRMRDARFAALGKTATES